MEVWYSTGTGDDGTGWWIHYEILSPLVGAPYAHGWAAAFPADAEPTLTRFGPTPCPAAPNGTLDAGEASLELGEGHSRLAGKSDDVAWDIEVHGNQTALYTFPSWAWEREILPGAQIVDIPGHGRGTITVGDKTYDLRGPAAQAHIFSHGSAHRWGWLHADLGGGDLLEAVAAVPHLPGGLHVPARPTVRLRYAGVDMPAEPLLGALTGRATTELPKWSASVRLGRRRRLFFAVDLPPDRCVQLEYPNPDGSFAYCTNTERANAYIRVDTRMGSQWSTEAEWNLEGRAHSEVGLPEPWSHVAVSPGPDTSRP